MYKLPGALALTLLIFIGCKKNDDLTRNSLPLPVVNDARTVLLKDIDAENLPAPYFHFEYDSLHYVKKISVASQLFVYDVEYENGRVKKMVNEPDQNLLLYTYNDKAQVSKIDEFSGTSGKLAFRYEFVYNPEGQLIQSFSYRFSGTGQADLIKRVDLIYYADGNLASLNLYYAAAPGASLLSSKEEFFDYDTKTNVDDIVLLKDFFGSYRFLPQVKLQKNNPKTVHISNDVNEYEISNSYEFRDDLPLTKYSLVNQTKGGNGQGPIQVSTHFSYY
jgi:hypothetical protein